MIIGKAICKIGGIILGTVKHDNRWDNIQNNRQIENKVIIGRVKGRRDGRAIE
jgi:hypothetical protein